MLTRPNIFFLLTVLFSINVLAQKKDGVIKGTIVTADENAIYATVQLKKSKKIVVTDNGVFEFQNLPALDDSIIITSIVFQRISLAVKLEKN